MTDIARPTPTSAAPPSSSPAAAPASARPDRRLPAPRRARRLRPALRRLRLRRGDGAETGNRPLFIPCDITDTAALKAAINGFRRARPRRVLVNNAANDERHTTLEVDEAYWDWSMAINLKAYFFAAQAVIPGMQAAGTGDRQLLLHQLHDGQRRLPDLHRRQFRHQRPDPQPRPRIRPRPHPRQRARPRLGAHAKQKDLWVTPEGLQAHVDRQCLKDTLEPEDVVGGTLFLASLPPG
jgi:galactose dehydrogenase